MVMENAAQLGRCIFNTATDITLFGRVIHRLAPGHEVLMQQALQDLANSGFVLPEPAQLEWLVLGNIRTDIATLDIGRARVPWWRIALMIWTGAGCSARANHPAHAMRCRRQSVASAYQEMRTILEVGLRAGCDPASSWQTRALRFGSALHTLQDSYSTAHACRINNGDPHSPIIDMHTYPSRQHPISTKKDEVWPDATRTALKPEAAAAVTATVAALRMFVTQSLGDLERFLQNYVAFRGDIAAVCHPI
jgi:hypothetical protein